MAKWIIVDQLTNIEISGAEIKSSVVPTSEKVTIGGEKTNAILGSGSTMLIASAGIHSKFLTIDGAVTNISLNSAGAFNITTTIASFDHYAVMLDSVTNIPLDVSGRLIVKGVGTATDRITISDTKSNVYKDTDGSMMLAGLDTTNDILQENGDFLLQENGDKLLLES